MKIGGEKFIIIPRRSGPEGRGDVGEVGVEDEGSLVKC